MAEIELHKEYNSSGESVQGLFDRVEEGFFVPLYQREYTWEEENINQLFDDLVLGVRELSENEDTTTFLGTTILTTLGNKEEVVKPGEERAQPTAVQIVIDGQQRISTLGLISIQTIVKLEQLLKNLPRKTSYTDLRNAGKKFIKRLEKLHRIEHERGAKPPQKPKIIHGRNNDLWTYKGNDNSYKSPVARYIATFIRTQDAKEAFSSLDSVAGKRVSRNIELIDKRLEEICDAHIVGTNVHDQFPVGENITAAHIQEYVLGFSSDKVKSIVEKMESSKTESNYHATAIYQLLLLTYYLLCRCGMNRLQPSHEEWGFDMFQSLNSTGTPLTVMETFLPEVVRVESTNDHKWEETPSYEYMEEIQNLFEATTTNERKNQRTNELLGTFALCYEGKKLGNKFSEQRSWIMRIYEKQLTLIDDKREFIRRLAQTANFFYHAWYMEDYKVPYCIRGLEEHPDGELASLLIQYLRRANSKLSIPILARFYAQFLDGKSSLDEFIESVKACAAFFTLWRSANSTTSGLDNIYRRYFKGSNEPIAVKEHNWKEHPKPISTKDLKQYFLKVLKHEGIANKKAWITASEHLLLYNELKTICRFMLFVSGHDRIANEESPGLTSPGTRDTCTLLNLNQWMAKDYKSVEHVAPQNPPTGHKWDRKIYENNLVQQLGNLILLPANINRLADNKSWAVKYLYYCHVAVRSRTKLGKLRRDAKKKEGITLTKKTIDTLSEVKHNRAIEAILYVGENGTWNARLIKRRTKQMKELSWEMLFSWLQP